jgi:hypothetical protein
VPKIRKKDTLRLYECEQSLKREENAEYGVPKLGFGNGEILSWIN